MRLLNGFGLVGLMLHVGMTAASVGGELVRLLTPLTVLLSAVRVTMFLRLFLLSGEGAGPIVRYSGTVNATFGDVR